MYASIKCSFSALIFIQWFRSSICPSSAEAILIQFQFLCTLSRTSSILWKQRSTVLRIVKSSLIHNINHLIIFAWRDLFDMRHYVEIFVFIFTWLVRAIDITRVCFLCSLSTHLWRFQRTHRRAWESCCLLRGSIISVAQPPKLCWGAAAGVDRWFDLFSIDYIIFTDFRIYLISIFDDITINLDISLKIANFIIFLLAFNWPLGWLCVSHLLILSTCI